MIVRLANGAGFMLEHVRCWDHPLGSPRTLRIHLADGVTFNVCGDDMPSPAEVEALLIQTFGPVFGNSPSRPKGTE